MIDLVGRRVHRYSVLRLLGKGGMGTVFEAEDVESGIHCALKVMHAEVAKSADNRRRFLREARAAKAVEHANIVRIHDIFEHDGAPALTMDLLEGRSLEQELVPRGKLPLGEVARHLVPIVSAVGHAHAVGIVHRDLKPENVFLTTSGTSILLDFGIVKLTHSDGAAAATQALTQTGFIVGTPFYMSPEQACGEKVIDHRSDIWSLGIILYRCLSGVIPTASSSFPGIFSKIVAEPIAPLDVQALGLPVEVVQLITKMLQKKPDDRPSDLREVFEMLSRYADVEAPSFASAVRARQWDDPLSTPSGNLPGDAMSRRPSTADGTLLMPSEGAPRSSSSSDPLAPLGLEGAKTTVMPRRDGASAAPAPLPSFGGSTHAPVDLPKSKNGITIALVVVGLLAIAAIVAMTLH